MVIWQRKELLSNCKSEVGKDRVHLCGIVTDTWVAFSDTLTAMHSELK